MTASEFRSWMQTLNLSDAKAAQVLGLGSRNTIKTYKSKGAPLHVGLACTAIALGLPQWGSFSRQKPAT